MTNYEFEGDFGTELESTKKTGMPIVKLPNVSPATTQKPRGFGKLLFDDDIIESMRATLLWVSEERTFFEQPKSFLGLCGPSILKASSISPYETNAQILTATLHRLGFTDAIIKGAIADMFTDGQWDASDFEMTPNGPKSRYPRKHLTVAKRKLRLFFFVWTINQGEDREVGKIATGTFGSMNLRVSQKFTAPLMNFIRKVTQAGKNVLDYSVEIYSRTDVGIYAVLGLRNAIALTDEQKETVKKAIPWVETYLRGRAERLYSNQDKANGASNGTVNAVPFAIDDDDDEDLEHALNI